MLMLIIFIRLGEAYRSITTLQERLMVATATVTIAPIDHPDLHRRDISFPNLFDEASQLT